MKKENHGLTEAQLAELQALADMPDDEIDFSDIPETLDWSDAKRGRFYRPVKQQITLRLDADIIAWFKAQTEDGKGYQTAINRVLREYAASCGGPVARGGAAMTPRWTRTTTWGTIWTTPR